MADGKKHLQREKKLSSPRFRKAPIMSRQYEQADVDVILVAPKVQGLTSKMFEGEGFNQVSHHQDGRESKEKYLLGIGVGWDIVRNRFRWGLFRFDRRTRNWMGAWQDY